jgi:hypothetical protein
MAEMAEIRKKQGYSSAAAAALLTAPPTVAVDSGIDSDRRTWKLSSALSSQAQVAVVGRA